MLWAQNEWLCQQGPSSWLLLDWIWENPIDIDSVTLRPLPTATAKWSPHHHLWADSWLATNYHQDGALTSRGGTRQTRAKQSEVIGPRLGCNGRCWMRHNNVVCLQKEFANQCCTLLQCIIWYGLRITEIEWNGDCQKRSKFISGSVSHCLTFIRRVREQFQ